MRGDSPTDTAGAALAEGLLRLVLGIAVIPTVDHADALLEVQPWAADFARIRPLSDMHTLWRSGRGRLADAGIAAANASVARGVAARDLEAALTLGRTGLRAADVVETEADAAIRVHRAGVTRADAEWDADTVDAFAVGATCVAAAATVVDVGQIRDTAARAADTVRAADGLVGEIRRHTLVAGAGDRLAYRRRAAVGSVTAGATFDAGTGAADAVGSAVDEIRGILVLTEARGLVARAWVDFANTRSRAVERRVTARAGFDVALPRHDFACSRGLAVCIKAAVVNRNARSIAFFESLSADTDRVQADLVDVALLIIDALNAVAGLWIKDQTRGTCLVTRVVFTGVSRETFADAALDRFAAGPAVRTVAAVHWVAAPVVVGAALAGVTGDLGRGAAFSGRGADVGRAWAAELIGVAAGLAARTRALVIDTGFVRITVRVHAADATGNADVVAADTFTLGRIADTVAVDAALGLAIANGTDFTLDPTRLDGVARLTGQAVTAAFTALPVAGADAKVAILARSASLAALAADAAVGIRVASSADVAVTASHTVWTAVADTFVDLARQAGGTFAVERATDVNSAAAVLDLAAFSRATGVLLRNTGAHAGDAFVEPGACRAVVTTDTAVLIGVAREAGVLGTAPGAIGAAVAHAAIGVAGVAREALAVIRTANVNAAAAILHLTAFAIATGVWFRDADTVAVDAGIKPGARDTGLSGGATEVVRVAGLAGVLAAAPFAVGTAEAHAGVELAGFPDRTGTIVRATGDRAATAIGDLAALPLLTWIWVRDAAADSVVAAVGIRADLTRLAIGAAGIGGRARKTEAVATAPGVALAGDGAATSVVEGAALSCEVGAGLRRADADVIDAVDAGRAVSAVDLLAAVVFDDAALAFARRCLAVRRAAGTGVEVPDLAGCAAESDPIDLVHTVDVSTTALQRVEARRPGRLAARTARPGTVASRIIATTVCLVARVAMPGAVACRLTVQIIAGRAMTDLPLAASVRWDGRDVDVPVLALALAVLAPFGFGGGGAPGGLAVTLVLLLRSRVLGVRMKDHAHGRDAQHRADRHAHRIAS